MQLVVTPGAAVESEQALIGALIQSATARENPAARVRDTDFSDRRLRTLYRTVLTMEGDGRAVDPTAVLSEVRSRKQLDEIGGELTLRQCLEACHDPDSATSYAEYVRTQAIKRRVIDSIGNAGNTDDVLTALDRESSDIRNGSASQRDRGMTADHMFETLSASFTNIEATTGRIFRYPADLDRLNRTTGGIRRGEFVIQAATTNTGKTIFAVQQMLHWMRQGKTVLYANTEMSLDKMTNLLVKMLTGLEYRQIEKRDIEDQPAILDAARELQRYSYEILRPRVWAPAEVESIVARDRPDVVIYDHLNRIASDPHELAEASRHLRNIALEYDCAVICLQQLNEPMDGNAPTLNHLRGSKSPGEEADQVLLLHREKSGDWISKDASIMVAKSRTSGRDRVPGKFDDKHLRFVEED